MILGRDELNPLTFPKLLIESPAIAEGGIVHIQVGSYLSDSEQSTVRL